MTRVLAAVIAIAASIGAGIIHLALGPEHLEELGRLGWGFYLAAALQVAWAAIAVGALGTGALRARSLANAGIAINVTILGAWVISRTVGIPAGEMPWLPEPIGRADTIAAALEAAIVVAILLQRLERPARSIRRAAGELRLACLATALVVVVIAAGTVTGLAPDGQHAAAHEAITEGGTVIEGAGGAGTLDDDHAHEAGEQEHAR